MDLGIRILLLAVCGLLAGLSIPLILRRVRPNWIYGFRTPRTVANPAVWYPANVFAGWGMLAAAALSAAALCVAPSGFLSQPVAIVVVMAGPLMVAAVASLIYLRRLK